MAQADRSAEAARALRKRGGKWIKVQREAVGLTQRELALAVGLPYYSFVSSIEVGSGKPPPELYEAFARALHMEPKDFAWAMLRYYDPWVFKALGGIDAERSAMPDGAKVRSIGLGPRQVGRQVG